MKRKPFFYDITLRDGNQALKKPWSIKEKEIVFNKLVELGVNGIEVGFPSASDMDFEACQKLANIAPDNIVISALARSVKSDIKTAIDAIKTATIPRVHVFLALSPFHMKHVLNKEPHEAKQIAIDAVKFAKEEILKVNKNGQVQFSVEHFGDCEENIDFVIETLKEIVKAGADVINLPNTVERYRIKPLVDMVNKVYEALPKEITIAVHHHNDLGMSTASTVESFYAGATQLECSLNGLGERAGNTNMYEVAIALYNSDVELDLNLEKIYETALVIAQMSNITIHEKAPLIGSDALAHRSGIHQDGAIKTKDMKKGAYRAIDPSIIGRKEDERIGFTSQSGKTAVFEIITRAGYPISIEEAIRLTPIIKKEAETTGEVPVEKIVEIYFKNLLEVKGAFEFLSFTLVEADTFELRFNYKDKYFDVKGYGNGPVDACLNALSKAGFKRKLSGYEQIAVDAQDFGAGASAISTIHLMGKNGQDIIGRACDKNTARANVKAIFNAMNLVYN
ncbi:MAG: 2-isopropylmalate synthase [Cyanobacteria bacterium SIG30]|nr:2-isopropylmalate synthase [Cyanobacteria bacterium SIG30]